MHALELLTSGTSDTQVAEQVGVNRRTIYRWRRDAAFAAELLRRQRGQRQVAAERLQAMLPAAFDVLDRQLRDQYDRTAYRAASLLVRTAFRRPFKADKKQAAEAEMAIVGGNL